jgi:hypothetical protein
MKVKAVTTAMIYSFIRRPPAGYALPSRAGGAWGDKSAA